MGKGRGWLGAICEAGKPRGVGLALLAGVAVFSGCGGRSDPEGFDDRSVTGGGGLEFAGGTPSLSGTGGAEAHAGGAVGGSGGLMAVGSGGFSPSGGASGSSGAPSFPECTVDEDCEIANDCCACRAVPKGAPVATCRLDCDGGNACQSKGLTALATCALGRCTVASCNSRLVSCLAEPPACPAGETHSVTEDGCWGPCIVPSQCSRVGNCADCDEDYCVTLEGFETDARCYARHPACEPGNLCECLTPCGSYACAERDGRVFCICPGC